MNIITPETIRDNWDKIDVTKFFPKLNKYIIQKPSPKQTAFLLTQNKEVLFGGAASGGKGQKLDDFVLTPFGFKQIKDLRVGDAVNNPDGTVAKIIQLHPVFELEKFKVLFHDGTSIEVNGEHLWVCWRARKGKKIKGKRVFGEESAQVIDTFTLKKWSDESLIRSERDGSSRRPLIPVCHEQVFNVTNRNPSNLDPYLLGYILGDGCISGQSVSISGNDHEHIRDNVLRGMDFRYDGKFSYFLKGQSLSTVRSQLEKLGLMGTKSDTKFVPREFLMGSVKTRLSVLQGLLDTDGTADARGQVYYTTTSEQMCKDVCFIVRSLGGVATVSEKYPFYRDASGEKVFGRLSYTIYIRHRNEPSLFRIKRKAERCKVDDNLYRAVVRVEKGGTVRGRCITVSHPNGMYLTNDFIVTHNSSALLMSALQYVDVPGYAALLLRRTYRDLSLPQALMSRAIEWLSGTDARWDSEKHQFTFPSGATLTFGYLESERDKLRYQGAEIQFCGFDELTQFTESQYLYLFSRIRRVKGVEVPLRMRAATNPGGPGHVWVKKRFIDEGRANGRIFIPATINDNPAINAEEYAGFLAELDPVTRARLLFGDWDIEEQGEMFKREWFDGQNTAPIENFPPLIRKVRYWDLAATVADYGNNDPDYTAGVLMGISSQNEFYILDVQQFRGTPSQVEELVKRCAVADGYETEIYIEQEPGASGKTVIDHYRRNVLPDFIFDGFRMTGQKVHRAKPFSGMCEARHVYLAKAGWNRNYLQELELFPNKRVHDDMVDASSGAYMKLAGNSSLGGIWF